MDVTQQHTTKTGTGDLLENCTMTMKRIRIGRGRTDGNSNSSKRARAREWREKDIWTDNNKNEIYIAASAIISASS